VLNLLQIKDKGAGVKRGGRKIGTDGWTCAKVLQVDIPRHRYQVEFVDQTDKKWVDVGTQALLCFSVINVIRSKITAGQPLGNYVFY
jgi:hypothetical protein